MKEMTQTIVLYQSRYGSILVNQPSDYWDGDSNYVRVSEPLTVTFKSLADKDILDKRVACLDKQIEKTRAELTAKVNDLLEQKQRLLAIEDKS